VASNRLHAQRGDPPAVQHRQHLLLKRKEIGVEGVQGHLHGVEGKPRVQHRKVNVWIFVSGKPHKPDLPLLLGLVHCFGCAVGSNK
jgi:hypothetical protein